MNDEKFVIKDRRLMVYTGNEHTVNIPDGIEIIGERAFNFYYPYDWQWNSDSNEYPNNRIVEIKVPESVRKIEDNAFGNCKNLEKIEFCTDNIEIADNAFGEILTLADKNGMYIHNDILYVCSNTDIGIIRIPDNVKRIVTTAFTKCKCDVEMSVNCPEWTDDLLFNDGTIISFLGNDGKKCAEISVVYRGEPEKAKKALSKALSHNGNTFNYDDYDAVFGLFSRDNNKIKIAVSRLEYQYKLTEKSKNMYLDYIKNVSVKAGIYLLENRKFNVLYYLAENGCFSKNDISKLAEWTSKKDNIVDTAFILDIGNRFCSNITEIETI